jgi:flagellar FliL protein
MADKKAEAAAEDAEAPKGKKKKLLMFIIIGVVVLVLIIAGAAAFFLMKKKPVDEEDPDAEATEEVAKDKKKDKKKDKDGHAAAPVFHKFDKPFTVKLQTAAEQVDAYLMVEMQFKVLDATTVDHVKAADAELKHKITITLLGKTAADLSTAAGVQRLSNEIRDLANHVLDGDHGGKKKKKGATDSHAAEPADEADPDSPVQAVLFTTFIIQ